MEKIGKYKILGKIGEGGMGVVYRALDPLLERVVAVKTISSRLDAEPVLRARFFREGRSAAQLSHKNIITVYDLGEDDGMAYMAMEYLDGEDLRAKIRRRGIKSLDDKLVIIYEICAGLAHAHGRRVIHRDIKPANVFVTASGQLKILDFGLARVMSTETSRTAVTHGSPNYMSPEQIRGDNLDHRTDIFSAGALFYELLTYVKPFDAESITAIIFNILNNEPDPPHLIDPALPPQLSGIVMKALMKDREARYQSMLEVINDLREYSPFVRSLAPPQLESEHDGAAVMPGIGSWDPTVSPTDKLPERTMTGPPVPGLLAKDDNHAALPPHRHGRLKTAFVLAVSLAVVLTAAGLWRTWRHTGVSEAGTAKATEPHPPGPVMATSPSPPARNAVPLPAGTQTAEAPKAQSQVSSVDKGYKPASAAHDDSYAPANPSDVKEASATTRESDETAKIVQRGVLDTKALMTQGKYVEASASLRGILRIAPADPAARQLAAQLTGLEKNTAEDSLRTMTESKNRADAAAAAQYAARSLEAAQSKETSARAAYGSERFIEAATGFIEASGLYLNAALEAQSEKAVRENRAITSEQEQQRTAQRHQADLSRNAYEQERLEAVKANADTIASLKYQEAAQIASDANSKWDRDDYPGAKLDFDKAAEAMLQAKAAALNAARKPDSPATEPSPKPAISTAAVSSPPLNNQQAITVVLQQYAAALESRDMQMLRNIWPSIGGEQERALREEFRNAREIQVQLAGIDIKITGDAATATARRTYILLTVEGQKLQTQTRIAVELRRNGKVWSIDKIHFAPI